MSARRRFWRRSSWAPEAVIVLRLGGAYGDLVEGRERWCRADQGLPSIVPLVFDLQHHQVFNLERREVCRTLEAMLRTWPEGTRPKVHFSSPRTQKRQVTRTDRKTGKKTVRQPPVWNGHAGYNHPFEFIALGRAMMDLSFEVMREAKAKDLALLRLRSDLARFAPDVAQPFGLHEAAQTDEPQEIEAEALAEA